MLERRILENILILKLNHKPVNQLDLAMLKALNREIKEFQSSSMRGLILQSESKKIFSAGLDLKTLLMKDSGPLLFRETILNLMSEFQTLVYNILSTPQPTLSLIEGFAPAGGTVLALATDYRVGSSMGFSMGLNEGIFKFIKLRLEWHLQNGFILCFQMLLDHGEILLIQEF